MTSGAEPGAVKAASPVLNGEDEETGRKALRFVLTQHHHTGAVLAYVFGRRQDEVFLRRKALLEPLGLRRFYTDHWGAYTRHLAPDVHSPGKRNTPRSSVSITLRVRIKRLVRKTICFSKTIQMHDIVLG